ncbi:hypothetical protein [Helicobacter burdigaliensis]|uniref:hypothetical protein n=1 Tax=Helicobacter burdigaliensis TaxID=2315334 RepID=UPI000EF6586F|nr:hypothetical protein [Helicobacter burdigaliensis]
MKKCCPSFPIAFIVIFAIGAFLYYQYSFSSVLKINFKENGFFIQKEKEIEFFEPKELEYHLCFYSSHQENWKEFLIQQSKKYQNKILAIDLYQNGNIQDNKIVNLKVSSRGLLNLINGFEIKQVPLCFALKQNKENPYSYEKLKENGIYKLLNFKK